MAPGKTHVALVVRFQHSEEGSTCETLAVGLDPVDPGMCLERMAERTDDAETPDFRCYSATDLGLCSRDSGAPVLQNLNGTWQLVGVSGAGTGCGVESALELIFPLVL